MYAALLLQGFAYIDQAYVIFFISLMWKVLPEKHQRKWECRWKFLLGLKCTNGKIWYVIVHFDSFICVFLKQNKPIIECVPAVLCFTQYATNTSDNFALPPDSATWTLLTENNYRVSNKAKWVCELARQQNLTLRKMCDKSSYLSGLAETARKVFHKKTAIKGVARGPCISSRTYHEFPAQLVRDKNIKRATPLQ